MTAATLPEVETRSPPSTIQVDGSSFASADDLRRSPSPIDQFGSYTLLKVTFVLMVLLPLALAGIYQGLIAADQYAAEARFGVRTAATPVTEDDVMALLSKGIGRPSAGREPYMVANYLQSRNLVHELDQDGWLRVMFSRPEADWYTRFDPAGSEDELWRYWRRMISVSVDRISGLISVRVLAFRPEDALALSQAVGAAAERMVDRVAERARQDALQASAEELQRARDRYAAALQEVRVVRDAERIVAPEQAIEAVLETRIGVLREKLGVERQLNTSLGSLSQTAPQLTSLRDRIRALEDQLQSIDRQLTNARSGQRSAAASIARFEQAELERMFSERLLEIAKTSYERARFEAERQHLYLASFVQPALPERADYPQRLRTTVAVGTLAFVVWGIVMLVVAGIRDQRLTS